MGMFQKDWVNHRTLSINEYAILSIQTFSEYIFVKLLIDLLWTKARGQKKEAAYILCFAG